MVYFGCIHFYYTHEGLGGSILDATCFYVFLFNLEGRRIDGYFVVTKVCICIDLDLMIRGALH